MMPSNSECNRMKNEITDIDSFIFDLDGTLIDSVPVYFEMMAANAAGMMSIGVLSGLDDFMMPCKFH